VSERGIDWRWKKSGVGWEITDEGGGGMLLWVVCSAEFMQKREGAIILNRGTCSKNVCAMGAVTTQSQGPWCATLFLSCSYPAAKSYLHRMDEQVGTVGR
jgi:hypothetical protein